MGQRVLVISHQPLVGEAVAKLCGLEPGAYRLGTSALTHIALPLLGFGQGQVLFVTSPRLGPRRFMGPSLNHSLGEPHGIYRIRIYHRRHAVRRETLG